MELAVTATAEVLTFAPADGDPRQTFRVEVSPGVARMEARVLLGTYARDLLEQMSRATAEETAVFASLARTARERGVEVGMQLNGTRVDAGDPVAWPQQWNDLRLTAARLRVPVAELNDAEYRAEIERLAGLSLLLMLSLAAAPVHDEDSSAGTPGAIGLPEGAIQRIEVNRYERSRINRAACIAIHGDSCLACGLRLADSYGNAAEGLIHVHHVTPVSRLGAGYLIDPATDLVPLCPNCHAVAHTCEPPLAVEVIRDLVGRRRSIGLG